MSSPSPAAVAPASVRRPPSGPGAVGAPVDFGALSPFGCLTPPVLLGRCVGHMEAGPESGFWCLPLAPGGRDAGLAMNTFHGACYVVSPCEFLRFRSWAAVLLGARTPSHTRPVSQALHRAKGLSATALGLFGVDAGPSPCTSAGATPGSRARVSARVCRGWVAQAGL